MGASVRIEDDAFSDTRYDLLARYGGLADADHARGKMARIWRQCTLEGRHTGNHPHGQGEGLKEYTSLYNSACQQKHPLDLTACDHIRDYSFVGDAARWIVDITLKAEGDRQSNLI